MITHKDCTKCQENKPVGEFVTNRANKDGLSYWCKDCFRIYREANREKFRRASAKHYAANKEARSEYARQWYIKNQAAKAAAEG